jgi:general secretion pathway protein L
MSALVVFDSGRWVRVADGAIAERGEALHEALPLAAEETVVAVLPGSDVTVRTFALPDLSDAQANAAARLAFADASLGAVETMHVAAGPADEDGNRPAVAVDAGRVSERLRALSEAGLDPDRLLAAPLLLPIAEDGYVRATFDAETVLRGPRGAFVEDAALTPVLVGDASVTTLERAAVEDAVVRSVDGANADLRHGAFAKRRRLALQEARLKRLAAMVLALGLIVLASEIAHVVRLNWTASSIEADNRVKAAAILPPGTTITDPALQAEARLTALTGAGGGFTPLASAFATAVNTVPGAELGGMVFDGEGGLRATVRATSAAELAAVEARLAAAGVAMVAGPIVDNQGRPYKDITVRAR